MPTVCLPCAWLGDKVVKKAERSLFSASSHLRDMVDGSDCFQSFPPVLTSCPLPGNSSVPPTQCSFPVVGYAAGHVACSEPVVCEQMVPAGVWKAGLPVVFSLCEESFPGVGSAPSLGVPTGTPPADLQACSTIIATSQPEELCLCFQSHWVWGCTDFFDNS